MCRLRAILTLLDLLSSFDTSEQDRMTEEFKAFVKKFEAKVIPLHKQAALAYFSATISGKEEDYSRAADFEVQLTRVFASKEDFETLKRIREANTLSDPILRRQLDVLYLSYLEKQLEEGKLEEMIRLQNENEKKFSIFRAEVEGKKLTDNEIEEILRCSTNSIELEAAWIASKEIGSVVANDVLRLVRMRNEAAHELGFANYHTMRLELGEQNSAQIEALFDELDELTAATFAQLKSDMDAKLAERYDVAVENLMPWHYQNRFFQEAPKIYDIDLDVFYKDKDIVALAKRYFAGLNMPIDDLVEHSDLFEKEGKYQHAYCTDIDRAGDVRVVCNIKPTYNWMDTTLHEYGHAVYDKFNDRSVPWVLREPAHTFTTEAIAMLFGRFASNPGWLEQVAGVPAGKAQQTADIMFQTLRLEQLVFSRWAQVMYRFEKALYENPDQDLNSLWWQLVEKYQLLRKPEGRDQPDWASKIHVALYPAYYHNYLMGELLASQLHAYICREILKSDNSCREAYVGRTEAGTWFIDNIFKPGRTLLWNDMIENATGEKLTAKYYAAQFVN
ncbi:M2 family metallopeptidase [Nitrosomonas sp. Nm58]|uniref:M2 family metallopeptidase n=1 Tax=Nitrosomonas sp. Nm58 TaxID=200126 RepID=UPI00089D232D|nr:M2 family metallopeptidase [Nitrosomonas sp. Nm58]SDY18826.1 peptidyl-dipeptidase A [Nitrosomonas sp. Nm58]